MQSVRNCNLSVVPAPAKKQILPRISQNTLRLLGVLRRYVKHNDERLLQLEAELRALLEAGAEIEPGNLEVQLQRITTIVLTRNR